MKKTTLIFIFLAFVASVSLQAQKLLKPFDSFSRNKTTYVVMEDGSEEEGKIRKLKRKKGLIKEIHIMDESETKKKIPIEDINFVYLPQSGIDGYLKASEYLSDATQWNDGLVDKDRIKDGYAFFEKTEVKVKKKKRILLMQLLNPTSCSRIKIYHDPFANETASVGISGIKVAGGKDRSYYIRIDNGVAFKLKKRTYKKQFSQLFASCKAIKKKYKKAKWSEFEEVIFDYNASCEK